MALPALVSFRGGGRVGFRVQGCSRAQACQQSLDSTPEPTTNTTGGWWWAFGGDVCEGWEVVEVVKGAPCICEPPCAQPQEGVWGAGFACSQLCAGWPCTPVVGSTTGGCNVARDCWQGGTSAVRVARLLAGWHDCWRSGSRLLAGWHECCQGGTTAGRVVRLLAGWREC